MNIFSDDVRRNPYPLYDQLRTNSPVLYDAKTGLWMVFDYDGVKRVLDDHETFSSRGGPAEWLVFSDPPRHTKLRALISQAFTPRSVANLEPRIRRLCLDLLEPRIARGEMDLAADFSVRLPMMVIAEMLGVPADDLPLFRRWNSVIMDMSYTVPGGGRAEGAVQEFRAITAEMSQYLSDLLAQRRVAPRDDLLTRLLQAQVDGDRLTPEEILGFFQGLLVAGSETTTNLLNNAVLCFLENPGQLERVRQSPELLPGAIEEVLRYRSPLQWMFRLTTCEVQMQGQVIPPRKVVLAMMGSANHDPKCFPDPTRFDVRRNPNPHIAFGHGIHFCLGAALARVESRIALGEFLNRVKSFRRASDEPWEPHRGLHVHGPQRLPIHLEPA